MAINWDISVVEELGSTQDSLKAMNDARAGTVLQALSQTSGHGRHGRSWDGGVGNLMFSFVLEPKGEWEYVGLISLLCSLAIQRSISEFTDAETFLKWPNDVLLDGRKCAGILLEREGDRLVVGIGVNIASAPAGIGAALSEFCDVTVDDFKLALLTHIDRFYTMWCAREYAQIISAWKDGAHNVGSAISVKIGDKIVRGAFHDLDERGNLLLSDAQNNVTTITAGDVYIGA